MRTIRDLISGILSRVYPNTQAVKFAADFLRERDLEIAPRIAALESEVDDLRRALAYYYYPSEEECEAFYAHEEAVSRCGGSPVDREMYWADRALTNWRFKGR